LANPLTWARVKVASIEWAESVLSSKQMRMNQILDTQFQNGGSSLIPKGQVLTLTPRTTCSMSLKERRAYSWIKSGSMPPLTLSCLCLEELLTTLKTEATSEPGCVICLSLADSNHACQAS